MKQQTLHTPNTVDDSTFRNVIGHFASGVAIVTTAVDGVPYGTTVSAVSSLSMDPPMMLVCLNRSSNTHDQVKVSGRYVVNVLSSNQSELAYKFAKKGEKFTDVAYELVHGVPVLQGALAHIICDTAEEAVGGTHTVFLGRAIETAAHDAQPLAYYRGNFGLFQSGRDEAAYSSVRNWVLEHRELRNQSIPLSRVVDELGMASDLVGRALAKLAVDRLIAFAPDELVTILPITAELMSGCIEGRAAIECGVLTTHMDALTDSKVAEIRATFDAMQQLRGTGGSMREFLDLNASLQNIITSLAASEELNRAFQRMGIGSVWVQTVPRESWAEYFSATHQERLVRALEQRDATAACAAVQAHAQATITLVQSLIEQNNGEV